MIGGLVALTLVATYLLLRYVPGFKCISFCKYKQIKHDKAVRSLQSRILYDESGMMKRVVALRIDDLSLRQMYRLYNATKPFGCRTLGAPSWLYDTREMLKNNIADKELLES